MTGLQIGALAFLALISFGSGVFIGYDLRGVVREWRRGRRLRRGMTHE